MLPRPAIRVWSSSRDLMERVEVNMGWNFLAVRSKGSGPRRVMPALSIADSVSELGKSISQSLPNRRGSMKCRFFLLVKVMEKWVCFSIFLFWSL